LQKHKPSPILSTEILRNINPQQAHKLISTLKGISTNTPNKKVGWQKLHPDFLAEN